MASERICRWARTGILSSIRHVLRTSSILSLTCGKKDWCPKVHMARVRAQEARWPCGDSVNVRCPSPRAYVWAQIPLIRRGLLTPSEQGIQGAHQNLPGRCWHIISIIPLRLESWKGRCDSCARALFHLGSETPFSPS